MPILSNNRRERFCQGIAKGLSATEAYREAGYRGRGNIAEVSASQIFRNLQVEGRIAELQQKAVQKHQISVEGLTRDLMEVHAEARKDGQYAAAVAAHALVAKMHGFIVDRTELHGEVVVKPTADPDAPLELPYDDWSRKYGGKVIEH